MHPRAIVCLILLLPSLLLAQPDPQQLGERLRAAVAAYGKLVDELRLQRLPPEELGYDTVEDNLQRLGERLEALSRLALETEAAGQPDWPRLADAVAGFENDLQQLRCQSLPLRTWAFLERQGRKQPQWGLAVSHAQEPLPRELGAFDAEPAGELELTIKPGEPVMAQIIVIPLTRELRRVRAPVRPLRGEAGTLPSDAVSLLPVDYDLLAGAETAEPWWSWAGHEAPPDVALGESHSFLLVLDVPLETRPGAYRGRLSFSPDGVTPERLDMQVRVTVPAAP